MRQAIVVFLSSLLIACSASKKPMAVQVPNDAWWQSANTDPSASSSEKNLATVRQQMMKSVPFPFVVGLSDST
ncbi:MAG: hypothetical protein HQ457_04495, partial [Betaproteobacteria bacterium]|nr:hypothetical protein [Betaproteobacteria bacterium]